MEEGLERTIYDLETSLLKPEVRSSATKLDSLLADDFVEFGSSGEIYDKKTILERLPEDTRTSPAEFAVSGFQVRALGEDVALEILTKPSAPSLQGGVTEPRLLLNAVGARWARSTGRRVRTCATDSLRRTRPAAGFVRIS